MGSCCGSCGAPVAPVYGSPNPVTLSPGPAVGTRVVTDPGLIPKTLPWAETDAHVALTRGLAEYLSTLQRVGNGGRAIAFKTCLDQWPEPEAQAKFAFPWAAVYGREDGKFDANAALNPQIYHRFAAPDPVNTALFRTGEYTQLLQIDADATDPIERAQLMLMCQEGLSMPPVVPDTGHAGFMYGVRLWLPHYYGAVATYEPMGYGFVEDADSQLRRERKSVLLVQAKVAMLVLVKLQTGTPVSETTVGTASLPVPAPEQEPSMWAD